MFYQVFWYEYHDFFLNRNVVFEIEGSGLTMTTGHSYLTRMIPDLSFFSQRLTDRFHDVPTSINANLRPIG